MKISPINNSMAFQSVLPPAIEPAAGNCYHDYWDTLAENCTEQKLLPELQENLLKLKTNGNDNILALDYHDQKEYTDYFYRLYNDVKKLQEDRKNSKLLGTTKPNTVNGQQIHIRVFKNYPEAYYELSGNKANTTVPRISQGGITKALLGILRKILTPETRQHNTIYGLNKMSADGFLQNFRMKV